MQHGKLVDDHYVSLNGPFTPALFWDEMTHLCTYEDGVTIGVGKQPCP